MRRTSCLFLVILIMFLCTSCSNSVDVDPIAADFLNYNNVENSKIKHMDMKEIDSFAAEDFNMYYSEISERIHEVLKVDYCLVESGNKPVESGDVAEIKITVYELSGKTVYQDENVAVVIGVGTFDYDIEKELVGLVAGESVELQITSTNNGFLSAFLGYMISIQIQGVSHYDELVETEEMLKENGFGSFDEYYRYLYEIKVEELCYEYYTEQKASFFEFAFSKCEFLISKEDLKNYSLQVVDEYKQAANSFGLTLEEYYSNILQLDDGAFFEFGVKTAEEEIKKCLLVGAIANRRQLSIDDEFLDFCEKNIIDKDDESNIVAAKYYCLENVVLKEYIDMEDKTEDGFCQEGKDFLEGLEADDVKIGLINVLDTDLAEYFSDYTGELIQRIALTNYASYSPAVCPDIIFAKAEQDEKPENIVKKMIEEMLLPLTERADDRLTITAYQIEEQKLIPLKDSVWILPMLDVYYSYEGIDLVTMAEYLKAEPSLEKDGLMPLQRQGSESTFFYILMENNGVYRLQRAEDMITE